MRKSFLDSSDDEPDREDEYIKKYKIIVIGDRKVGKSSLIKRLKSNEFSIQYIKTKTIEIYNSVMLGDIEVDIWDVPPNVCKYYNVTTLKSNVILLMFDSDQKESLERGINLYRSVRDKIYTDVLPELWFVYRGKKTVNNIEYCHPDRLFHIDNMSRDGIFDLIYDIRCKILKIFT
jgi:hypothetical protein